MPPPSGSARASWIFTRGMSRANSKHEIGVLLGQRVQLLRRRIEQHERLKAADFHFSARKIGMLDRRPRDEAVDLLAVEPPQGVRPVRCRRFAVDGWRLRFSVRRPFFARLLARRRCGFTSPLSESTIRGGKRPAAILKIGPFAKTSLRRPATAAHRPRRCMRPIFLGHVIELGLVVRHQRSFRIRPFSVPGFQGCIKLSSGEKLKHDRRCSDDRKRNRPPPAFRSPTPRSARPAA